jgi:hypothetical protein
LDATTPKIPEKARDDYTIGHRLIQADSEVDYTSLRTSIGLYMRSRSREHVQVDTMILKWPVLSELDAPTESNIISQVQTRHRPPPGISRYDLSLAFDPIAEPEKPSLPTTGSLEASVFDRTLSMIAVDIAPYVRSIVAYDAKLQNERTRMSNLLSEGGRGGKRMRTTRAAMSALEGGARKTTRKERYFGAALNPELVFRTAGKGWAQALAAMSVKENIGAMSETSTAATDIDELPESSQ